MDCNHTGGKYLKNVKKICCYPLKNFLYDHLIIGFALKRKQVINFLTKIGDKI